MQRKKPKFAQVLILNPALNLSNLTAQGHTLTLNSTKQAHCQGADLLLTGQIQTVTEDDCACSTLHFVVRK